MIQQWTPAQVHDTVAAIVAQSGYRGQRQSLAARIFRWIFETIDDLLRFVRGWVDPKIFVAVVLVVVVAIIAARVIIDRGAAERRARGFGRGGQNEGRRNAWMEARTLADSGQFVDAIHALYSAVVAALTASGTIRYHRSKTAGDYARELRRARAPIAADFRAFGREFDRLAFGGATVSRADYDTLASLAERIVSAPLSSAA